MTTIRLSSQSAAACSAARRMFGLFGNTTTSRDLASLTIRRSSPVEGFAD